MKSSELRKEIQRLRDWGKKHPRKLAKAKARWVHNNRERWRAYRHQYYLENKERQKKLREWRHSKNPAIRKRGAALYRKKHPHRIAEMGRIARYGITNGQVAILMKKQRGRCAICDRRFIKSVWKRRRCIDHCHKTNSVRGILCHQCNLGIGHFNDDLSLLIKAVAYLKQKQ
jgi:hypothetical protein